jgi:hypothetical protein
MENKFPEGSVVVAIKEPNTSLRIRRYVDRIYFCETVANKDLPERVYFEREIKSPG